MTKFAIMWILMLSAVSSAQTAVEYQGRPRYPDGLLALKLGAGPTKYLGQFTDQAVSTHFTAGASVAIFPELALGVSADMGTCVYERRERRLFINSYAYQYGAENAVPRSTWYTTFNAEAQLHLFPRHTLDGYVFGGAGVTFFNPDDYAQERGTVRPFQDKFAALTLPAGVGVDCFLFRNLALNVEWRYTFLFTDDFDGFNSALIAQDYMRTNKTTTSDATDIEARDGYSTVTVGLKYFLFENKDLDGDMLPNDEEEALGTNPYDPDTDGDGLSDYDEVRLAHTDPKLRDTDGDGLSDYVEFAKYRTNPLAVDSDGDGISDQEEVMHLKTNPLAMDTDGDDINDAEELRLGTNPREADTDHDNLSDSDELHTYHTNPLVADSDGDGLGDYEEALTYGSSPLKPDTDGDGLTDFEEVAQLHTNPLLADTDGDGLSDGDEYKRYATNPMNRDSDGDGVPDNLDRCPLLAGAINGAGCPEHDGLQHQAVEVFPVKRMKVVDTLVRIDTLVIREGGLMTLFGVNFEVNRDVIRPEAIPILEENAKLFSTWPDMVVEIRGHTDSDGSPEKNQELSAKRAQAVKRFLEEQGVAGDRLQVKGFGQTAPIASNETAFGKARNRRIEFYIVKRGMQRSIEKQLYTGSPALLEGSTVEEK